MTCYYIDLLCYYNDFGHKQKNAYYTILHYTMLYYA